MLHLSHTSVKREKKENINITFYKHLKSSDI